jgi:hypothetical protein
MSEQPEQLFDVIVYEIDSGKVESIVGEAMRRDTGYYNAEKRLDTVSERLNDLYSAAIVDAGTLQVGDTFINA